MQPVARVTYQGTSLSRDMFTVQVNCGVNGHFGLIDHAPLCYFAQMVLE